MREAESDDSQHGENHRAAEQDHRGPLLAGGDQRGFRGARQLAVGLENRLALPAVQPQLLAAVDKVADGVEQAPLKIIQPAQRPAHPAVDPVIGKHAQEDRHQEDQEGRRRQVQQIGQRDDQQDRLLEGIHQQRKGHREIVRLLRYQRVELAAPQPVHIAQFGAAQPVHDAEPQPVQQHLDHPVGAQQGELVALIVDQEGEDEDQRGRQPRPFGFRDMFGDLVDDHHQQCVGQAGNDCQQPHDLQRAAAGPQDEIEQCHQSLSASFPTGFIRPRSRCRRRSQRPQ